MGPAVAGSPDVNVNGRPAVRVGDMGVHAACCGPNLWTAQQGSNTVFINGKAAHRVGDMNQHCGGVGKLVQGSENVIVGDSTSGGGGGGAGSTVKGDAGGAAPPAAAPAAPEQPKGPADPTQGSWRLEYSDGKPVRGWVSLYVPPSGGKAQELPPDGAGQVRVSGLREGHLYDLSIEGRVRVQGQVLAHDGKGLAGAVVTLNRAYGPGRRVLTDGSGGFTFAGLVEEEAFDVTVDRGVARAEVRFVDEEGKPRAGIEASILLEDGARVHLLSGADGFVRLEHPLLDEGYALRVDDAPPQLEGRFEDEGGKPLEGVVAVLILPGNRAVPVRSDQEGRFRSEHHKLDEGFALRVVTAPAVAEGQFVDEQGRPLQGVRAVVRGSDGTERSVLSDDEGRFRTKGLSPGEYYTLTVLGAPEPEGEPTRD